MADHIDAIDCLTQTVLILHISPNDLDMIPLQPAIHADPTGKCSNEVASRSQC